MQLKKSMCLKTSISKEIGSIRVSFVKEGHMKELFEEDAEELLQELPEEVDVTVMPTDNDPMNARRRLEDLLEEKRLREILDDFWD